MKNLRFAMIGAGFWARYQLAAWQELPGVECAALCDRTRAKAEALAAAAGVPAVYDDAEELFRKEGLDFVDVVTDVDSHPPLVHLAAARGVPVICQKPMSPSLTSAEEMVAACRARGVPFFVHENWRWQVPIREVKRVLQEGGIGKPFRARISMVSGFPVFVNQPYFKQLEQFLIADMGSHLLDVARFFFGEAESLYCQTARVHPDIRGEDAATVMLRMGSGTTVTCDLGFAENFLERDPFPQTHVFIEAGRGSLELAPDYWVRTTTETGTFAKRCPPPRYPWADPAYDVAQASMVPCHANLLQALRGGGEAETTAEDNLKTVRLVFAAYESALNDHVVRIS
jgi:predicted dehydrogenase